MSVYTPDRWVMIEIESKEHGKIRKILGSWYGGFAGSDSWKLSSGNTAIIDKGDYYEIPQESGSVYNCYKQATGMSGYTSGILASWQKQLDAANNGSSISIISEYNAE